MAGLRDLAIFCAGLVTVITATTLVAHLPPVRWLWGQLVSRPLERFWTRIIKEGASQFHEETVRPQIAAIEVKVDELVAASETSWHKDKAWIVSRITIVEDRQKQLIHGVRTALEKPREGDGAVAALIEALTITLNDAPATPRRDPA